MNWIDYLLIALVVFSCVAGVLRGLLREVITLVTWVAAVWISWHYADVLAPHLGGALASEGVRTWAARTIIFLGVVLIGTCTSAIVGRLVRLSIFSGTDRFFGGLFGFLRGLVMIGLFVMLCASTVSPGGVVRPCYPTASTRRMCCVAWSASVKYRSRPQAPHPIHGSKGP